MSASIGFNTAKAAAAASSTTDPGTTQATGSTFVIGVIAWHDSAISTPTDSFGNTYVPIEAEQSYVSNTLRARWYYCENGAGGANHTATGAAPGAAVVNTHFVEIVGGLTSSILDTHNVNVTGSPFNSPSITTTQADEIVLSFFAGSGGATPSTHTAGNSFSLLTGTDIDDGNNFNTGVMAYRSLVATATLNSVFTETANSGAAAVFIAGFKSAAAASSFPPVPDQGLIVPFHHAVLRM